MSRSLKNVLERPGNDSEQAFAHGYKTVSKGIREHTLYSRPKDHNYKDYMAGKRAARLSQDEW